MAEVSGRSTPSRLWTFLGTVAVVGFAAVLVVYTLNNAVPVGAMGAAGTSMPGQGTPVQLVLGDVMIAR